ncbi:polyphosphate kinase 1 [Fischerella thermalis]|jgi:polyphosphate kinase|uniref:polyphosphate kinase 1 n=1 Tax=Fischerella thermalis TaxID=372787 RepID=UPI000C8018B6|nr:polyphosphate kinase 1 [Fischerella thermalis]PLZ06210.1 polyphosphate kinase 1 [Fischerella thermalis WC1110]PLZ36868.1 polyphosphate kinase 1 [Fischerella thermalis WC538]PLZ43424.1 polyphosphate kinase 1 [Fischerella thermalis WC527]PLZ69577.1 polyphosphate kinase 1 [Fischerella thermalis WC249]
MTKSKEIVKTINFNDSQYYFNRELSWLEFNRRVLHEALDHRTPLLERLKFTAIFSSNLDEFFMVRVAILKDQVQALLSQRTPDGRTPQEQLEAIAQLLRPMVVEQHHLFEKVLRKEMASHGIHLLNYPDITREQRFYLEELFKQRIFPVLTPLAVDPSHPFPLMANLSLNWAVVVKDPVTGEEKFARVKVPNILPRFIALPKELETQNGKLNHWTGIPIEQVVAHNLDALFPGMIIKEYHLFRLTRKADISVVEEEADDLLLAIQQELRGRHFRGSVVRLEIQPSMPKSVRKMLMQEMELSASDIYEIDGLINLKDLMSFMALPLPELKDKPWTPVIPSRLRHFHQPSNISQLDEAENIFSVIQQNDLLVHHPYESFSASVEQFIAQAARDPQVLAIKMTLYRTSGDSEIVSSLISAAESGKQVAALVELKARFDEENNINWAQKLEKSGVHVVYGLVGLKTHTKIVLVVRQEGERICRYVHIGTGNYNPKTAKLYTDLGLLSCREELGADLTDLFNYLTGYSCQNYYRKLLVSPVTMRDRMIALIRREIEHSQNGEKGRIIAKMNSLVDSQIIATLYEASQAGVEIDLIIRGICCLRPGVPDVSANIRVISIIGRFLEHSRIFHFHNNGHDEIYIGSADWMPRNLDRRVEAVTPVEDPKILQNLQNILEIMLADNRQAWELKSDGSYVQRHPGKNEPERHTQNILMEMASKS